MLTARLYVTTYKSLQEPSAHQPSSKSAGAGRTPRAATAETAAGAAAVRGAESDNSVRLSAEVVEGSADSAAALVALLSAAPRRAVSDNSGAAGIGLEVTAEKLVDI